MCNPVRYYDDSKRYVHTQHNTHHTNRLGCKDSRQSHNHSWASLASLVGYVVEHEPWPPEGGTVREVESIFAREFGTSMNDVVAQGLRTKPVPPRVPAAAPATTPGACPPSLSARLSSLMNMYLLRCVICAITSASRVPIGKCGHVTLVFGASCI